MVPQVIFADDADVADPGCITRILCSDIAKLISVDMGLQQGEKMPGWTYFSFRLAQVFLIVFH